MKGQWKENRLILTNRIRVPERIGLWNKETQLYDRTEPEFEADITLEIHAVTLLDLMGRKAARNRTKRTSEAGGLVVAKAKPIK